MKTTVVRGLESALSGVADGRLFVAESDEVGSVYVPSGRSASASADAAALLGAVIMGDDGDNTLVATQTGVRETLFGLDGNDTLLAMGDDLLFGGSGSDVLLGNSLVGSLSGDGGNDFLFGGRYVFGGDGDDRIEVDGQGAIGLSFGRVEGGAGDDVVTSNVGGFLMVGGEGADTLLLGADDFGGQLHNTSFNGGAGDDLVRVNFDAIPANQHEWEVLHGGAGDDDILSVGALVQLHGGDGNDRLAADLASDLWGGAGDDTLRGGDGDQHLWGGAGRDTLFGGSGHDVLTGDQGGDLLFGGAGADHFVAPLQTDRASGGSDRVADFDFAAGDRVDLSAQFAGMTGVDLLAEGFVRARAVTIDGQSYASIDVDDDGAAGKVSQFHQIMLIRSDDPEAFNHQVFWTFG